MGRIYLLLLLASLHLGAVSQVWRPLDGGLDATPTAITSEGKLIATAHIVGFEKGYRAHKISIWNGYYWLELPIIYADSNSVINSLKFYKGALYIAGRMNSVVGLSNAKHIIRWTNREYQDVSALSSKLVGLNAVSQLSIYDGQLAVSGLFVATNAQYGDNLAFFNGATLVTATNVNFGSGIKGALSYVYSNEDNIIAFGGRLTKVNDTAAYQMAIHQDDQWTRISDINIVPTRITAIGNQVYFSGYNISTKQMGFYLVKNDIIDTITSGLSSITDVYDLIQIGNKLVASGNFYISDDKDPISLIVFENNEWKPLPNGDLLGPRRLLNHNDKLIATGLFVYHNSINYSHIAEYLPDHGIIGGNIYFDKDRNCVFNSRDENLNNMNVLINPGGHYVKPQDNGEYFRFLPNGQYTVSVLPPKNWESVNCSSLSKNVKLNAGDFITNVNFPMVQKTGVRDLSIKLTSSSGWAVDKNQKVAYTIRYANKGSENISSTRVVLHYDSKLADLVAEPAPISNVGDSAVWEVKDFYAGEERSIYCNFNIDNSSIDALELSASIPLQENEEETEDNESHLEQTLTEGDYNFKKEIFPAQGDTAYITDSASFVEYQISFANYTTDTIFNVYVIDTIRLNHSLSIIQTTGASHSVSSEAFPGLPGEDLGIIVWTFKDINLYPNPSKNPEIVSHKGYVSFKLGLKPGLDQGTVLTNRAHVVFDYYEEEPTNWVYAIVNNQMLSLEEVNDENSFSLYPNPVSYSLYFSDGQAGTRDYSYTIYSTSGETVMSGQLAYPQIDVSLLSSGLYILRVESEERVFTKRFIKTQ